MPLNRIPDEQRDVCLDLIWDRRGTAGVLSDGDADYDPLAKLLDVFADVKVADVVRRTAPTGPSSRSSAPASSTATARASPTTSTRRWPAASPALVDRQRRPAGRHEGRRRAVRLGRDAAAVRAAVGRDDEDRGRLPRAAHGEGRGRRRRKGRLVLATVKGDVHDIGKNLVDIILTNNGYEVHNLGIKISVAEMIEKALEVDADAIGMSGLLVKSDADHAREPRGAELPRPVEDPRAARRRRAHPHVRRARPARGVRGSPLLRQGRLRGPPRHGPAQRAEADGRGGPRVGPRARRARPARDAREGRGSTRRPSRPARPRSAPTTRCSCRRSSARRSSRASALDDIAGVHQRDRAVPQPVAVPAREGRRRQVDETDEQFKDRIRPTLRALLPTARPRTCSSRRSSTATSPANGDGNDLVIWTDETRTAELARFHYPRQQTEPWLCIADFFRPRRRRTRSTTPRSTS